MRVQRLTHCLYSYRSLNGEGNFNWRLKFKFSYYPAEQKLVVITLIMLKWRWPCSCIDLSCHLIQLWFEFCVMFYTLNLYLLNYLCGLQLLYFSVHCLLLLKILNFTMLNFLSRSSSLLAWTCLPFSLWSHCSFLSLVVSQEA